MGPDVTHRPEALWRVAALAMMRPEDLRALLDDPRAALPWVEAAAESGLPEAQLRLGRMLLSGDGAAKDEGAAFAWFERAAEDGDAEALNMLGRCHENGWGAAADVSRAAVLYSRAAAMGHAWAQYNLGHLLLDGNGVARDPEAAFQWYSRAAAQGHERAMNLVARCYEQGWGVARDAAAARAWYAKSAEGEYFRGCYNYASVLLGEGRVACALLWFKRALASAPTGPRANMLAALAENAEPSVRALALSQGALAGAMEGLI